MKDTRETRTASLSAEQQAREDEIMDATYNLLEVLAGEEDILRYRDIASEIAVHVAETLCASGREVYWPMVYDSKGKGIHVEDDFPLSEEEKKKILEGKKKDDEEVELTIRVKSTYGELKKMLEKSEQ